MKGEASSEEMKRLVFRRVDELVYDFLYHARKHDDKLPVGTIDAMVGLQEISEEEIVSQFKKELKYRLLRTIGV